MMCFTYFPEWSIDVVLIFRSRVVLQSNVIHQTSTRWWLVHQLYQLQTLSSRPRQYPQWFATMVVVCMHGLMLLFLINCDLYEEIMQRCITQMTQLQDVLHMSIQLRIFISYTAIYIVHTLKYLIVVVVVVCFANNHVNPNVCPIWALVSQSVSSSATTWQWGEPGSIIEW